MRTILTAVVLSGAVLAAHGGVSLAQTGQTGPTTTQGQAPAKPAQGGSTAQQGAPETEDQPISASDFVYVAAVSILFDIEAARLAAERASSPAVRDFAKKLIADRQPALEALRAAAAGEEAPSELDKEDRQIIDNLAKEKGADFDAAFIGMMIDSNEDALDLHQEFSQGAKDEKPGTEKLRAYVATRLDPLARTMKEAEQLEEKLDGTGQGAAGAREGQETGKETGQETGKQGGGK